MSNKTTTTATFHGLKGVNIRETERALRAAKRVRRAAYAALCAERKALKAANKPVSRELEDDIAYAYTFCDLRHDDGRVIHEPNSTRRLKF